MKRYTHGVGPGSGKQPAQPPRATPSLSHPQAPQAFRSAPSPITYNPAYYEDAPYADLDQGYLQVNAEPEYALASPTARSAAAAESHYSLASPVPAARTG